MTLLNLVAYQQAQLVLHEDEERVSKIWAKEQAITKIKRDRRREWCADMCLFANQMARSVVSVLRTERNEKGNIQSKRDRRREWLSDLRLIAFAMTRSVISFWGIVGWMFVGTVFGGLMAHNLLSRAVLCDRPVCMWLRFDGEKFWE